MEEENKNKIKQYALIKVGKNHLLKLYDSFNTSEKEFRQYLDNFNSDFEKGNIEYYAIREDNKYIVQVTVMYNNLNIEESTIKDKRIYLNKLSIVRDRSQIGFEALLLELVVAKLKNKKIGEYTISIGNRERKMRNILENLNFQEYREYINPESKRKELLMLRKDKIK